MPLLVMSATHRLGHVALRVQDMERAKRFYLGLGLRLTWEADDWCYVQWPSSGEGIALLSPDYKAAGPHFAFHFQDRAEVDQIQNNWSARDTVAGRSMTTAMAPHPSTCRIRRGTGWRCSMNLQLACRPTSAPHRFL